MIWYDVSGLYNWKGNFTGIQRVVYNLAEGLERDNKAKFFIFQQGNFIEVSFDQLKNNLARLNKDNQLGSRNDYTKSPKAVRHYGAILAKNLVVGRKIERPVRLLYKTVRNVYRTTKKSTRVAHHDSPFKIGDIIVVADGNWQFPEFAFSLIKAKKNIGFKIAHVVYDLVAVKNPALASKGAERIIGSYFKTLFPYCDLLLAISESTKRDIEWFIRKNNISHLPIISTFELGSDVNQSKIAKKKPTASIPREFILAVGTIEVRKNYMLLYYAYKHAHNVGIDLPYLIIVGRKGWMADETHSMLVNDPDVASHITIMDGPGDEELEWLYANCLFTVYPSFYEGWGLPVSESLLRGKCCVSSNTSSMPEAGGDLVHYVSPYDPAAMEKAIKNLTNTKERRKLELRIRSEYQPVTWQDSYEEFLKATNLLS